MAVINSYLNFNGNTEEAFNFYKSVFGGEFVTFQKFKDAPDADQCPEGDLEKVMHVALPIGHNVLMGTDTSERMPKVNVGNNFSISISPSSEQETHKLFDGLSAGGQVTVPLAKMFWGALFGMFTDKFGIQWMVNYDERLQG